MRMGIMDTPIQLWFWRSVLLGSCIVMLVVLSAMVSSHVAAEAIYSYLDDQGTLVWTNNYDGIPERYRAKVKTTEGSASPPPQTSSFGTIHTMVTGWAKHMTGAIGGIAPEVSGLSPYQSKIAMTGGLAGLICVIAMYLSQSQVVRFLSLWVLILLGVSIPVLLFTSQDGAGDVMKAKAVDATKKQQDRLQQVP